MRTASHQNRGTRWRIAAAVGALGMFAWGMAALIYVDTTGAHAENEAQFQDIETVFLVPQDGQWFNVKIGFFMFNPGDGSFDSAAETARAEMLARFPGAIEIPPGSVSAAFVTSGFKWMSGTASWGYNNTGAPGGLTAHPAMQAGAATWGQQGANFAFTGGGVSGNGTGACGGGTDGSNTVGWGAQSGSVLAVTCSWFSSQGSPFKSAVEFDMEFDPDWNWTTGNPISVDLESVALHEFGHALGLNHSGSGAAVMFPSYSNGSNKRTPDTDDVNGLIAIYGQQGVPPTATPTNTPAGSTNTPTPSATPTRTPTPGPGATNTPTPGGGGNPPTSTPTNPGGNPPTSTPTPPGGNPPPTSTPTRTPTPGSGGGNPPPPPPPTNTPVPQATNTPASPTATKSATPPVTASPTPNSGAPSLPILPGANLMAWPGSDLPPAVALAGVPNLKVVYSYDAATGHWKRYIPGAPAFLSNLTSLKKGGAYWFIATGSASVAYEP